MVLASYVLSDEVALMTSEPEKCQVFVLARLSAQRDTFAIESIKAVPYQNVSRRFPYQLFGALISGTKISASDSPPRIQFLAGGAIIVVQFSNAVALVARGMRFHLRLICRP